MCYNRGKLLIGSFKVNFLKLVYINLKLTLSRGVELLKLLPFYINPKLRVVDFEFFKSYFYQNPYRICRDFFSDQPHEIKYSYGETWVSNMSRWVHFLPITSQDVLYELGSGTGRVSFWIQILSGCQVKAIEKVSTFNQKALSIKEKTKNKRIEFLEEDILDVDYSDATLIYFYGTSFSDDFIQKLLKKWENLKPKTRVVTTSFSLNEYLKEPKYRLIRSFKEKYPWGVCDVYLQEKI